MIYIINNGETATAVGDVASLARRLDVAPATLINAAWLATLDETALAAAKRGINVPDDAVELPDNVTRVEEDAWEKAGFTARIKDGTLVLGKTDEQLTAEYEQAVREARYLRLRQCDKMSPMRWNSMTDEQRQAWTDYRQALLDITDQDGFPWDGDTEQVPWPEQPEN